MGLFDKLNKPVFIKEESDAVKFINKMKELQTKASGEVKERIDKEIKLASIGEIGENNISFELKNSGMPMYVMHDIHIETDDGLSAQIDYIVVTRKVTFIIECKNLIGNIDIDSEGNFIRNFELNGRHIKEGIYSPVTQNQRHLEILRTIRRDNKSNFLTKMMFDKYFDENFKSIVVLANPKTILNARYAKKEIKQMVIRADQLNSYIKIINQQSKQPASNDKEMKEFAGSLFAMHSANKSDYARKYEEIIENMKDSGESEPEVEKTPVEKTLAEKPVEKSIEKPVDINDNNDELIKLLKAFRLEKSREENIKPYFIFNDKQMMDLLSKRPHSKEELQEVSGFGKVKAEKYGDRILKIIDENR